MKLLTRILSLLVLAGLTTFYVSCSKDHGNKKTDEEVQLDKLKSLWTLTSAKLDGASRTDFTNLVLTLGGTFAQGNTYTYSFTGTRPNPSPWPASGTWKFGTNVKTDIIRDPNSANEINMNYTLTDTSLLITFTVPSGSTGWAGGRTQQVSGNWEFQFTKQ